MTAGNLARRSGSVKRTGTRAVAEGLSSIASLTRIPLINNHLDCHLASPHAGRAFLFVGSCRQSPVTALPVDRKRRWYTPPRWRWCFFGNPTYSNLDMADLVELNSLNTRIGNRQRLAGDGVSRPELVFGVGAFSHTDEKFAGLTSDTAAYPERVTQIRVAALIERAAQANPRLHGNQNTMPACFLNSTTP